MKTALFTTYGLLGFYGYLALKEPTVILPPAMFVSILVAPLGLGYLYLKALNK